MNLNKRKFIVLSGCAIGLLLIGGLGKPAWHLLRTALQDKGFVALPPAGYADDASRLNQTKVAEVWRTPINPKEPEKQLAELLARAKAEGRRVSIAGARHSMGGHTIYPGGIVIDTLPMNHMHLNQESNLLTVQAGAMWKDIIPYLDKRGRSVGVMQSNDSFSVGGSISVNCHGWQYNRPPIASTVESFRLMLADGRIFRCSRHENKELFSLVLGGYGLFGIILDVELRVVPNERYRMEQYVVPVNQSMATFESKIKNRPGLQMIYARMNVVPNRLFENVILNAFFKEPGEIPSLTEQSMITLRRAIFRGSAASEYGKELRYNAEALLQPLLIGKVFSRNQLLNESTEIFGNRSSYSTDILHEYFVPRSQAGNFVNSMRKIIRQHKPNLLNVTVRLVNEDKDTFLRYADGPIMAFVMLYVQEKTATDEARMQELTRALIDAAIKCGGRYYLPYRLHATHSQFYKAYPMAHEFFKLKRKYDPEELFQNYFYLEYKASLN